MNTNKACLTSYISKPYIALEVDLTHLCQCFGACMYTFTLLVVSAFFFLNDMQWLFTGTMSKTERLSCEVW